MDHHKIAIEGIVQPGEFDDLPNVDMTPKRDVNYDFRRAKDYIFNEHALLDKGRFFDVIAQSNAKFWQSIGERSPVDSSANLRFDAVAQITLERLYREPSIVRFVELMRELKAHVHYTSSLPSMQPKDADETNLHEVIAGYVVEGLQKFNVVEHLSLDDGSMSLRLQEDDSIMRSSRLLSDNFHSEILDQYNELVRRQQKNSRIWKQTKISATLKFPLVSVGSEWEKRS